MQHDLMKISNNISNTGRDLGKMAFALGETPSANEETLKILFPLLKASKALAYSVPAVFAAATAAAAGTGFAAGKIIDTDDNPSNLKTAAIACGSSLISAGIAYALANTLILPALDEVELGMSFRELRKNLKDIKAYLTEKSTGITDQVFNEADVSREEFERVLKEAQTAFAVAIALDSAISLALLGMTISNATHGYRRNNNSVGYALAWMCTGPGGFGLSRAQGWGQPIGK